MRVDGNSGNPGVQRGWFRLWESGGIMSHLVGSLRRLAFGISAEETSFARRGFPGVGSPARGRLERVAGTFVDGYHAGLLDDRPESLGHRLNAFDSEVRGFAFEGAAMALALLDVLTFWRRNRVRAFLDGPGSLHCYMVHVGVGWALARLGRRPGRWLPRFDPLLGWLIVDGYGFHEGFFDWRRHVGEQVVPERLAGYERRMFDHGLGRCVWFVDGAEVGRISGTIGAFSAGRRGDLWSGVGLACGYAGGVDRGEMEALRAACGMHLPQVAQGVAFAAKARQRANNMAPHTEEACSVLCGLPASEAAAVTDAALEGLPTNGTEPMFEAWQKRIQSRFALEVRA